MTTTYRVLGVRHGSLELTPILRGYEVVLALLVGDLVPLVVAHALWDFVPLAPARISPLQTITTHFGRSQSLPPPVEGALMLAACVALAVFHRGGPLDRRLDG
jgi:hypothetical protein